MQLKKRDDNLVPILVAIVALIGLAFWYNYLGDYTIKKVDAALGIDSELRITDLVIEKGYTETAELHSPELKISYLTSRSAESYIEVDDVISNKIVGQKFSKTITLSRDFFGKNVEVRIYAKDAEGKKAQISRNISLPTNLKPVIIIINT